MGRVTIQIKLQNWDDLALLARGKRKRPARLAEVEALVDTGAVKLYLQSEVIERLGLRPIGSVQSRTMSNRKETPARLRASRSGDTRPLRPVQCDRNIQQLAQSAG